MMNEALRKVLKRLHYPIKVMLVCVRWYAAYPLSLRHIEERMAERGVIVDHATVHRWAVKILPIMAAIFRRRKRPVGLSWQMDETYVRVGGEWKYLYRAVDKAGQTIDFLLRAHRDYVAARCFFERAIDLHGVPEKITIDKSGLNWLGHCGHPGHSRRLWRRHRTAAKQVPEQSRRAGSPGDQADRAADTGVQVLPLRTRAHRRHRDDARDQERSARWLQRPSSVSRRPVLLSGLLTSRLNAAAFRRTPLLRQNQGAWRDKLFVERLWRPIKYEEVVCYERNCSDFEWKRCFTKDEGGPLGVGLQELASNRLKLRRLRAVVVSVDGKGGAGLRQVWIEKTNASEPLMPCRNVLNEVETGTRTSVPRVRLGAHLSTAQLASGMKAA